jgi:hypothetical protein
MLMLMMMMVVVVMMMMMIMGINSYLKHQHSCRTS